MKKIIVSLIIGMSTITMLNGTRGLYRAMVLFQKQLQEYEKNPRSFVAQPLEEDDEDQDCEPLEQEQIKQNPTSQQLEQEIVSRKKELSRKARTNLTLLEETQDARIACTLRWHNKAKNLTSKL